MSAPLTTRTLIAVACCAGGLVAPSPATAAGPASWSTTTRAVFRHYDAVVGPVSDGHRLWTIELPPQRRALLRSRSISTGKLLSSVLVDVPRSRGATLVGQSDDTAGPQLVIGRHVAAVTGTWCVRQDDDERGGGSTCVGARSFYARFSPRTGEARDRKLTAAPRLLVGGDRPAEAVRRPGRTTAIRDVVTRKTVLTVPETATDVEGAGRFIAWKVGRSPDGYRAWTKMRVVDRLTRRARYTLRAATLVAAVGPGTGENAPLPESATVTPDGAVDLEMFFGRRNQHPVIVDESGRIHRLAATFRYANSFITRIRGSRVLVSTEISAGDPKQPCVRTSSWLTDRTGRIGNSFRTVPRTGRLHLANAPSFVSPTAVLWGEETGNGTTFPYRYRVVPDDRELPLTTAQRPRC